MVCFLWSFPVHRVLTRVTVASCKETLRHWIWRISRDSPTEQKAVSSSDQISDSSSQRTLLRDPKPKVLELNAAQLLVGDFGVLVQTIGGTQGIILAGPVDGGCGSTNGRRKAHQAAWGGQSRRFIRRVWSVLRFSDQQAGNE